MREKAEVTPSTGGKCMKGRVELGIWQLEGGRGEVKCRFSLMVVKC